MPETSAYKFPWEALGDQPGHSLHGGSSGTEPILAERVEDELIRIENFIDEAGNRYLDSGWHPIVAQEGVLIDGITIFQVPPQQFSMIKMYFRGSLTTGTDEHITLRINNDSTPDLHRRFVANFDEGGIQNTIASDATVWLISRWSSRINNTAYCTIYNTHLNANPSMSGGGTRNASGTSNRGVTMSSGDINQNMVVSSLRVNSSNTNIESVRVWIEGYVA